MMHRQVGGGEKGVEVLFPERLNPRFSETTRHLYSPPPLELRPVLIASSVYLHCELLIDAYKPQLR